MVSLQTDKYAEGRPIGYAIGVFPDYTRKLTGTFYRGLMQTEERAHCRDDAVSISSKEWNDMFDNTEWEEDTKEEERPRRLLPRAPPPADSSRWRDSTPLEPNTRPSQRRWEEERIETKGRIVLREPAPDSAISRYARATVYTTRLTDLSISTNHIMDGAITTEKIADRSITAEKIGPNVRILPLLSDGIIVSGHLANNLTLTGATLAGTSTISGTIGGNLTVSSTIDAGAGSDTFSSVSGHTALALRNASRFRAGTSGGSFPNAVSVDMYSCLSNLAPYSGSILVSKIQAYDLDPENNSVDAKLGFSVVGGDGSTGSYDLVERFSLTTRGATITGGASIIGNTTVEGGLRVTGSAVVLGDLSVGGTISGFPAQTIGTWSPQLYFNGVTNGVTFFDSRGEYIKLGKMCHINMYLQLTSYGTGSGIATVSLPFANGDVGGSLLMLSPSNFDFSGYTSVIAEAAGERVYFYGITNGGGMSSPLQNTSFSNTTILRVCGSYRTSA